MVTRLGFEVDDFNKMVYKESHDLPVLVYFLADWCAPCSYLDPILEKLANKDYGNWNLIKVNIEKNPALAKDWGTRVIPNLKLFYKGEVIDEVSGAMSKKDIKKWLRRNLPSKAKSLTMEAARLLEIGKIADGIFKLEQALIEDDSLEQAKLMLARQKIWQSLSDVQTLLEDIKYLETAKEIQLLTEAIAMKKEKFYDGVSKNDLIAGTNALRKQDFDVALVHLIKAVQIDKEYMNELARRLVIALFHYLGESNDLTRRFRPQFDMAIY